MDKNGNNLENTETKETRNKGNDRRRCHLHAHLSPNQNLIKKNQFFVSLFLFNYFFFLMFYLLDFFHFIRKACVNLASNATRTATDTVSLQA